jgi:hypothetical protein
LKSIALQFWQQLPALVLGAILGSIATIAVNRFLLRKEQHVAARALTSSAGIVIKRLRKALDDFGKVLNADPEALVVYYFKTEGALLAGSLEAALDAAKSSAVAFPQDCLEAWRSAWEAGRSAQTQHEMLRKLVGRPDAVRTLTKVTPAYRQTLADAVEKLCDALKKTRKYAASDSCQAIEQILSDV